MSEHAVGMRKGGTIWWDDSAEYVDLLKKDGPVIIIGLSESGRPAYPELARILKTATVAEHEGKPYRLAHGEMAESGEETEGWWGGFATALLDLLERWRKN